MAGVHIETKAEDTSLKCDPIYNVSNLFINQRYSWEQLKGFKDFNHTNTTIPAQGLTNGTFATPCGLIAKSMFNDTF